MAEPAKKSTAKKTVHWHACTACRHTAYEDNCATPTVDGQCTGCRGGRAWQLLIDNRAPRDCCRVHARRATKDERKTYRLAGAATWFICKACARTQPYDPRSTS